CYCARLSPWAAEAGVETLDAMQGRGYATAAVAAWAAALRQRGLLPLYSTSWENVASQRVSEKVGAVCYGEAWAIDGVQRNPAMPHRTSRLRPNEEPREDYSHPKD